MQAMTPAECRALMAHGTRTAKLATVRADGSPHVVPVWFVFADDDTLYFTTWHTTVKAKNIQRDPRISISVDEEVPPYAFVMLTGHATLSDDLDDLRIWATRIGGRYMGQANAEAFGKRNAVPGELLVKVQIERLIGQKEMAA